MDVFFPTFRGTVKYLIAFLTHTHMQTKVWYMYVIMNAKHTHSTQVLVAHVLMNLSFCCLRGFVYLSLISQHNLMNFPLSSLCHVRETRSRAEAHQKRAD